MSGTHLSIIAALLTAAGCSSAPRPSSVHTDIQLEQSTSSARIAYDRGLTPQAIQLYRQALNRARVMDDAGAISDSAYNLAACQFIANQPSAARAVLPEAMAASIRAGRAYADILLLDAKAARAQDKSAEATALLDRVSEAGAKSNLADRVEAILLKGEIACDAKDARNALHDLSEARAMMTASLGGEIDAEFAGLNGRIELLGNNPAKAAALFDQQADLLRRNALYSQMNQALARGGEAYLANGQASLAADRWLRAARSAYASGARSEGIVLIQLAAKAAARANDALLTKQIDELRSEMESSRIPITTAPTSGD